MGQFFELINIDTMEAYADFGDMGQFFWNPYGDIIDRLTAPVDPSEWPKLKTPRRRRIVDSSQTSPNALILKLSVELLEMIANEIEQYGDLLCVAFTCRKLWQATESARYQSLRDHLRRHSWAGDRIILLGDNAPKLPEGLLSEEDEDWLDSHFEDDDPYSTDYGTKVYELASAADRYATPYLMSHDLHSKLSLQCDKDLRSIPAALHWVYFTPDHFTLRRAPSTSRDARWMLRNLDKREYVIRSRSGEPYVLSTVLFSLVGWSSDPSIAMRCDDKLANSLVRGRWAGDRIDVTLDSLHHTQKEKDGSEHEWKDITAKVLKRLKRIARSNDVKWSASGF